MAKALMFQGTGSDVGKSVLVAGFCRLCARRGIRVVPFKPQNMSNNAAVTVDGGEIGRAQWVQALAAKVPPTVHMNPVLLKPQSDTGAQVVVQGQVRGSFQARGYQQDKPNLLAAVMESFHHLSAEADLILVEGAGSPAEVNLRQGDIANMGFAREADCPVILIGDIDRGGVIASIVGTDVVMAVDDRAMVRGFLINKFRGDVSLFDEGYQEIEQRTGWRGLGVIPYLPAIAQLPAEDAVVLEDTSQKADAPLHIVVPMLSRISNFDDFDPLKVMEGVHVDFCPPGQIIPESADLIIIPGTKSTLADLVFLRRQGWDTDIIRHYRRGRPVIGVCGGYQMLGRVVRDPLGIESDHGEAAGLGLLDVETVLTPQKRLAMETGKAIGFDRPVTGYEIHMGETTGPDRARPLFRLSEGPEGAQSADGLVWGTYLHGLFAADDFRHDFLSALSGKHFAAQQYTAQVEAALEALANHLEDHVDVEALMAMAGPVHER
ncbi:MAG: cobyric acid synthase CobQ [Kordiimonas sp.]|nr:cobyric acid synthase CobQ [Kordiimonas sp.]